MRSRLGSSQKPAGQNAIGIVEIAQGTTKLSPETFWVAALELTVQLSDYRAEPVNFVWPTKPDILQFDRFCLGQTRTV